MTDEREQKDILRSQWTLQFRKAQQADSWGQVIEAQDAYQGMAASIAAKQGMPSIASKEKEVLQRIALCLSARAHALSSMGDDAITSADMKSLQPVFEVLFTGAEPESFPIEAHKYSSGTPVKASAEGEIICAEADDVYSDWQLSQAALKSVSGTVVCIRVEKIGLKDAQDYIDPFMTIQVADPKGVVVDSHDTLACKERSATYVVFNHQVYLGISLEDMHKQAVALFFEFKHYKPKKKKVSTRCWAFMELNELRRDEEIILELYHKPTDLKKRKVRLHSEKPLYLHLFATFIHS